MSSLRVENWIARTNKAGLFLERDLVPFQSLKGGKIYGHLLLLPGSSTFPSVCSPGITHPAELPCLHIDLLYTPEGLTNHACVSEVFWNYIWVERGLKWYTQMCVRTRLLLFLPTILPKLVARVLWFFVTWSWWDIFPSSSSNRFCWGCLGRHLSGCPSLSLWLRGHLQNSTWCYEGKSSSLTLWFIRVLESKASFNFFRRRIIWLNWAELNKPLEIIETLILNYRMILIQEFLVYIFWKGLNSKYFRLCWPCMVSVFLLPFPLPLHPLPFLKKTWESFLAQGIQRNWPWAGFGPQAWGSWFMF